MFALPYWYLKNNTKFKNEVNWKTAEINKINKTPCEHFAEALIFGFQTNTWQQNYIKQELFNVSYSDEYLFM